MVQGQRGQLHGANPGRLRLRISEGGERKSRDTSKADFKLVFSAFQFEGKVR